MVAEYRRWQGWREPCRKNTKHNELGGEIFLRETLYDSSFDIMGFVRLRPNRSVCVKLNSLT